MFETEFKVGDRGFLARLSRAKNILLGRGKQIEKELNEGDVLGQHHPHATYKTDAEESLAIALGKDLPRDEEIDRGLQKALEEI